MSVGPAARLLFAWALLRCSVGLPTTPPLVAAAVTSTRALGRHHDIIVFVNESMTTTTDTGTGVWDVAATTTAAAAEPIIGSEQRGGPVARPLTALVYFRKVIHYFLEKINPALNARFP